MSEAKEKTVPQSYRLPASQVDLINQLTARGILGSNRSAVVRTLLGNALKDLIENEFVKKYLETIKLLEKK